MKHALSTRTNNFKTKHLKRWHLSGAASFLSLLLFLVATGFVSCTQSYDSFCIRTDELLTETGFSGTVLIAKKNKIIFSKGYGLSDPKDENSAPNDLDTVFETGSLTKQMTAAAIMQLAQKGKLSVNDSLDKFFPDFENGSQITIKMLLNMRSGLTDFINCPEDFFPAKVQRQIEKKELAGEEIDRFLVYQYAKYAPSLASPDSTYFYSNTNYYLLALIIEQVSEMPYEEYMQINIFDKAGMKTANLDFQNTTARGYTKRGRYISIPKNMMIGLGDVNASAKDLLAWNNAFAEKKIVSKKSFQEMITSESYGYGVYRTKDSILHSGATHVFNSYNEYILEDKISIILLSNQPLMTYSTSIYGGKIKKLLQETE